MSDARGVSLRPRGAARHRELVDLDPAQRLGIFTQPAVIASHSGPTTTRLVKRGVFFTRKVMCMPLGVAAARRRHHGAGDRGVHRARSGSRA